MNRRYRWQMAHRQPVPPLILTIYQPIGIAVGPLLANLWRSVMRSMMKSIRVVGLICLLFGAAPVFSQTTTGRILGEVTDSSGAGLAGATVTVTDVQRATTRTVTADQSGNYAVPNLSPS